MKKKLMKTLVAFTLLMFLTISPILTTSKNVSAHTIKNMHFSYSKNMIFNPINVAHTYGHINYSYYVSGNYVYVTRVSCTAYAIDSSRDGVNFSVTKGAKVKKNNGQTKNLKWGCDGLFPGKPDFIYARTWDATDPRHHVIKFKKSNLNKWTISFTISGYCKGTAIPTYFMTCETRLKIK